MNHVVKYAAIDDLMEYPFKQSSSRHSRGFETIIKSLIYNQSKEENIKKILSTDNLKIIKECFISLCPKLIMVRTKELKKANYRVKRRGCM